MGPLTPLGKPRHVVLIAVATAGLIVVLVLVLIASDERQPHVELAPASTSLSLPAVPVASGAIAGRLPGWPT